MDPTIALPPPPSTGATRMIWELDARSQVTLTRGKPREGGANTMTTFYINSADSMGGHVQIELPAGMLAATLEPSEDRFGRANRSAGAGAGPMGVPGDVKGVDPINVARYVIDESELPEEHRPVSALYAKLYKYCDDIIDMMLDDMAKTTTNARIMEQMRARQRTNFVSMDKPSPNGSVYPTSITVRVYTGFKDPSCRTLENAFLDIKCCRFNAEGKRIDNYAFTGVQSIKRGQRVRMIVRPYMAWITNMGLGVTLQAVSAVIYQDSSKENPFDFRLLSPNEDSVSTLPVHNQCMPHAEGGSAEDGGAEEPSATATGFVATGPPSPGGPPSPLLAAPAPDADEADGESPSKRRKIEN